MAAPSLPLFSYGTLRQEDVQLANYGRLLDGSTDFLPGYLLADVVIDNPEVVAISGKAVHSIARATGKSADGIAGTVFLLTDDELRATDGYEVDAYSRVEAVLKSGRTAWVYVGPALED